MNTHVSGLVGAELCASCPAFELSLCYAMARAAKQCAPPALFRSSRHTIRARQRICREHDLIEGVPFVCQDWMASVTTLSDGRRQILAFHLPGDIVSAVLIFEPRSQCSLEAITEVQYQTFKRAELRDALLKHPYLSDKLFKLWVSETARANQLAVDLARCMAGERIARLILNLFDRLAQRGMTRDHTMDFPLRQHHIADATGLTVIHVNRVLSEFRSSGLIESNDRSLTILDLTGLRRVADVR